MFYKIPLLFHALGFGECIKLQNSAEYKFSVFVVSALCSVDTNELKGNFHSSKHKHEGSFYARLIKGTKEKTTIVAAQYNLQGCRTRLKKWLRFIADMKKNKWLPAEHFAPQSAEWSHNIWRR